jgi:glutamine amidotransferase
MLEAMTEAVRVKARPFFGICVGMQLMATRGKEHVTTDGFNWIAGDVEKITPREENLKIPHMGWNTLDMVREHPVLERLPLGPKGRTPISCTPITSMRQMRRMCWRAPITAGR